MESPENSGSFIPPLMISLAGIAASSIALLTYHLIVVRCCMRRRFRDGDVVGSTTTSFHFTPTRGGGTHHHLGEQGNLLKAIPIVSYSSGSDPKDDHRCKECVICLGELEEGDNVRLLPNCGHLFHVHCIDGWFMDHSSCPTCRSPIIAPIAGDTNLGEGGGVGVSYDHPIGREAGNSPQSLGQDHQEINVGLVFDQNSGVDEDHDHENGSISQHSVSLVLPLEYGKPRNLVGLKRSMSMDHSLVVIDIPREIDQKGSCSCSCSIEGGNIGSGSYASRKSTRQLDLTYSSGLFRTFSLAATTQLQATTTNQNFSC